VKTSLNGCGLNQRPERGAVASGEAKVKLQKEGKWELFKKSFKSLKPGEKRELPGSKEIRVSKMVSLIKGCKSEDEGQGGGGGGFKKTKE